MIRSRKYLNGSRGATCKLRIPGHCVGGTETTVACHIKDGSNGMGMKASDLSVLDGCAGCHRAFDLNMISREDWLFYALRGLQETLEQRHEAGLLIVPIDGEPALNDRPIKPRKAKEDRAKIAGRGFPKVSRKFGS